MKKIDVTKSVMARVVRFEKRRIRVWIVSFILILLIVLAALVVTVWWVLLEVSQRQTLELLTLWQEDPEIIAEYWPEVAATIWEELPRLLLGASGLLVGGLLSLWLATRRTRQTISLKQRELAKYSQTHKD